MLIRKIQICFSFFQPYQPSGAEAGGGEVRRVSAASADVDHQAMVSSDNEEADRISSHPSNEMPATALETRCKTPIGKETEKVSQFLHDSLWGRNTDAVTALP